MEKKFSPHLQLAKELWKNFLKSQDLAIDATCGNGHDTLFLANLCSVIGLDIQPQAIQNTEKLLEKHQKQGKLHLLSHDNINTLPCHAPPRLIVYNLGYLPFGDKTITTLLKTTLESCQKSLQMLASDGALSITCYPGHDEGFLEEKALEAWIATLPKDRWSYQHYKWPERKKSPSLIWIRGL